MAVYEQTYKRYAGKLTPEWSRFLIIPRHAFEVSSVQALHGVLRDLFPSAAGGSDPDLPASQRERTRDHEGQRAGVDSRLTLVLSDLRRHSGWLCFLCGSAGWSAAGFA